VALLAKKFRHPNAMAHPFYPFSTKIRAISAAGCAL